MCGLYQKKLLVFEKKPQRLLYKIGSWYVIAIQYNEEFSFREV